MKFEKRLPTIAPTLDKPSVEAGDLPVDYLRLVESTLTTALEKGLIEMRKIHPISEFQANGAIYGDEVLLTITLFHGENNLSATTVYVSSDFNPMLEKPSLEEILAACLDAAGSTYDYYLDLKNPEMIEQLSYHSLSALEEGPFDWAPLPQVAAMKKIPVWVKMDKSNPRLEGLADQWLIENDPEYQKKRLPAENQSSIEAEEFLNERLEAIKNAKSGSGGPQGGMSGGNGPITH